MSVKNDLARLAYKGLVDKVRNICDRQGRGIKKPCLILYTCLLNLLNEVSREGNNASVKVVRDSSGYASIQFGNRFGMLIEMDYYGVIQLVEILRDCIMPVEGLVELVNAGAEYAEDSLD